ncbi:hypothetical protein QUA51_09930 [Microcoleus sp. Pol10_D6]|uniref:hypothetical protein n=1 Tax=unclassified Microcoleus TaxID=2642155 RepID=UPI002FD5854B
MLGNVDRSRRPTLQIKISRNQLVSLFFIWGIRSKNHLTRSEFSNVDKASSKYSRELDEQNTQSIVQGL